MRLVERACRNLAIFFTRLFSVFSDPGGIRSRFGWIPRRHIMYSTYTRGRNPLTGRGLIPVSRGRDPPQGIVHPFISLPALLCAGSLQW